MGSLDQLLKILGPRHTSWAGDMPIIAGLLVGVDLISNKLELPDDNETIPEQETYQQDIYQRILKQIGHIGYGHLFHNLPTVSGGTRWCPSNLLSLPLDPSNQMLSINQDGSVVGVWKVITIDKAISYSWSDAHPLVAVKLRASLQDKAHHLLLAEPSVEHVTRALLVRVLDSTTQGKRCQFVGCLHLELSGEEDLFHPEETVRLINAKETTTWAEGEWTCNPGSNETNNRGLTQPIPMRTDLAEQKSPTMSQTAFSNTSPLPYESAVSFASLHATHRDHQVLTSRELTSTNNLKSDGHPGGMQKRILKAQNVQSAFRQAVRAGDSERTNFLLDLYEGQCRMEHFAVNSNDSRLEQT